MNTKTNKVLPVFLAVVAILAVSTFQVFAQNPSENEGASHRSSVASTAIADDHGKDPAVSQAGEDFSLSGAVQSISDNSITIAGKVVALAATTRVDNSVSVGTVVRAEVILQADGTLLAKEVESEIETENLTGDDHGQGIEPGDDKGGVTNSVDNHGSTSGSIDDHGGTSGSIDDHGSTSGSIDDHRGSSNSGQSPAGSSGSGEDHSGKGK